MSPAASSWPGHQRSRSGRPARGPAGRRSAPGRPRSSPRSAQGWSPPARPVAPPTGAQPLIRVQFAGPVCRHLLRHHFPARACRDPARPARLSARCPPAPPRALGASINAWLRAAGPAPSSSASGCDSVRAPSCAGQHHPGHPPAPDQRTAPASSMGIELCGFMLRPPCYRIAFCHCAAASVFQGQSPRSRSPSNRWRIAGMPSPIFGPFGQEGTRRPADRNLAGTNNASSSDQRRLLTGRPAAAQQLV